MTSIYKNKEKYCGFYVDEQLFRAFNKKTTAMNINKSAFFRRVMEDFLDGTYEPKSF